MTQSRTNRQKREWTLPERLLVESFQHHSDPITQPYPFIYLILSFLWQVMTQEKGEQRRLQSDKDVCIGVDCCNDVIDSVSYGRCWQSSITVRQIVSSSVGRQRNNTLRKECTTAINFNKKGKPANDFPYKIVPNSEVTAHISGIVFLLLLWGPDLSCWEIGAFLLVD